MSLQFTEPAALDNAIADRLNAAIHRTVNAVASLQQAQTHVNNTAMTSIVNLARIADPEIAYLDLMLVGTPGSSTVQIEAFVDADWFIRNDQIDDGIRERMGYLGTHMAVGSDFMKALGGKPRLPIDHPSIETRLWRVDIDEVIAADVARILGGDDGQDREE